MDARSGELFVPAPPFNMVGATVLDLPSDLWRDFVFFVEEARKHEHSGRSELRYRFLRAGLLSLFSHLNAMFDMMIKSLKSDADYSDFKSNESKRRANRPDWPRCEHGRFVLLYTDYLKAERCIDLPVIDWSIKPLRNLLAHPSGVRDVTVADLYDLDINSLMRATDSFKAWIMEACEHCNVEYEADTEGILKTLVQSLAGQKSQPERF
tara:strand:- start:455 stop:1081 length:627 start_codon:yes stop_codon:yes gene_type:complete